MVVRVISSRSGTAVPSVSATLTSPLVCAAYAPAVAGGLMLRLRTARVEHLGGPERADRTGRQVLGARDGAPLTTVGGVVAHTFEELVQKRRAADLAQHRVEELRDSYGPPTQHRWTPRQSDTYETAVRAWRDLDRDARTAMAEYVKEGGQSRHKIEAKLRKAVQEDDRST
ncbi:hypothetical protein GCM10023257_31310 [Streptomyces hyderabadensis]|uniref:Uncharacterized protein n=1 Tax=Streptomyces hyderabadensis TaxID=598549 RepID=A0ABP9I5I6_9ACTN